VVLVAKRLENGQLRWPTVRYGGNCAARRSHSFQPATISPQIGRCGPVVPSSLKKSLILF
jgi:hypothetical protein